MEAYVTYTKADALVIQCLYHRFSLYFIWLEAWEQMTKPPLPMLPAPKEVNKDA